MNMLIAKEKKTIEMIYLIDKLEIAWQTCEGKFERGLLVHFTCSWRKFSETPSSTAKTARKFSPTVISNPRDAHSACPHTQHIILKTGSVFEKMSFRHL